MSRRTVLGILLGAAATAFIRVQVRAAAGAPVTRFGVISDVHHDIIPDGFDRVRAFLSAMTEAKADFIVQLGDFCMPTTLNHHVVDLWNTFDRPRYSVLGNHDMDGGFSREHAAAYFGMPGRYYTFDGGAFLGVVLDGNDPKGKGSGYARYMAADQCAWLTRALAEADRPVILFLHQPLDDRQGVENGADVRAILERAEAERPGRMLATFAGHLHLDYVRTIGGLPYVQINSAAYYWVGAAGQSTAYFTADTHKRHRDLQHVAVYREPLWALVGVDVASARSESRDGGRSGWARQLSSAPAWIPPGRTGSTFGPRLAIGAFPGPSSTPASPLVLQAAIPHDLRGADPPGEAVFHR